MKNRIHRPGHAPAILTRGTMLIILPALLFVGSCTKRNANDYTSSWGVKTLSFTVKKAKGDVMIHQPVFNGNVELVAWMNKCVDSVIRRISYNFENALLKAPDSSMQSYPVNGYITTAAPTVLSLYFQDSCAQLPTPGMYYATLNLDLAGRMPLDIRDLVADDGAFLKTVSDSVRLKVIRMNQAVLQRRGAAGAPEPTLKESAADLMRTPLFEFSTNAKYENFRSWYVADGTLYIIFNTAPIITDGHTGVEKIPFTLASLKKVLRDSPVVQAFMATAVKD